MQRLHKAFARLLLLTTPVVVAGCPGSLEHPERFGVSPTGEGTDCTDVVPTLIEKKCAVAGCHAKESPQQGLDLESPGVASRLVGAPATGPGCAGTLADPAHPTESTFYLKLTSKPPCGARMPYLGSAITNSELSCVKEWIATLPGGGDPSAQDSGTVPVGKDSGSN